MSFIDEKIKTIALNFSENGINPLLIFRRFLDDILFIFLGSNDKLHKFLDEINKIAPSIKFTMQHTKKCSDTNDSICDCEPCDSIPFLDTEMEKLTQIYAVNRVTEYNICCHLAAILRTVLTTSHTV